MPKNGMATDMLEAAKELSAAVGKLQFPAPVACVYNPLDYAWSAHEQYLRRFANSTKRVVLLGMNPGPFGMSQTGVPFGEIAAVRDWMGIETTIAKPAKEHPKRPIDGFSCAKSEVSGRRLWGLFAERFGTPEKFFKDHFVLNYCPLVFMEESGRNLTPDKIPTNAAKKMFAACDQHLVTCLKILQPEWAIGIGGFALKRIKAVTEGLNLKMGTILHPSPASPAANKDWAGKVTAQLTKMNVWES